MAPFRRRISPRQRRFACPSSTQNDSVSAPSTSDGTPATDELLPVAGRLDDSDIAQARSPESIGRHRDPVVQRPRQKHSELTASLTHSQ